MPKLKLISFTIFKEIANLDFLAYHTLKFRFISVKRDAKQVARHQQKKKKKKKPRSSLLCQFSVLSKGNGDQGILMFKH